MKHFDNFKKHLREEPLELPADLRFKDLEPQLEPVGNGILTSAAGKVVAVVLLLTAISVGFYLLIGNTKQRQDVTVNEAVVKQSADVENLLKSKLESTPANLQNKAEGPSTSSLTVINNIKKEVAKTSITTNQKATLKTPIFENRQSVHKSSRATSVEDLASITSEVEMVKNIITTELYSRAKQLVHTGLPDTVEENSQVNWINRKDDIAVNSAEVNERNTKSNIAKTSITDSEYKKSATTESRNVDALEALTVISQFLSEDHKVDAPNYVTIEPVRPANRESRWSLGLGAGANTWSFGNAAAFEDIQSQVGYNVGGRIKYDISEAVFVSVGLSYARLHAKLESSLTETEARIVEDTIIGHSINSINGSVSDIRGDATVVDTITREVVHHNTYNVMSVPVIVGYKKQIGNWNLGLGAGPQLDILISYAGKYRQADEFILYSDTETTLDSSLGLSLVLEAYIQKELANNINVGTSMGISKSLNSWSSAAIFSTSPTVINSRVYLSYRF